MEDFPLTIAPRRTALALRSAPLDDDAKAAVLRATYETARPLSAAEALGYSPAAVKRAREDDPEWAVELEAAVALYVENRLETAADTRAVDGWEEPVYYKGEVQGSIRRFSDTLLIKRLEALSPDKYAKRTKSDVNVRAAGVLVVTAAPAGADAASAWNIALAASKEGGKG